MLLRAALLALLASCTDGDVPEDNPGDLDDLATGGTADGDADWVSLGVGVAYREENSGPGILIAYGGYTAKQSYVAAWATELVDQELGARDVGHIYIVRGPQDASYAAREIGNSKLRAHLLSMPSDAPIYIVAHSSGSYVAHELLGQLASDGVLGRVRYANLDGGGSGLTAAIARQIWRATTPTSRGARSPPSTSRPRRSHAGDSVRTSSEPTSTTSCSNAAVTSASAALSSVIITLKSFSENRG